MLRIKAKEYENTVMVKVKGCNYTLLEWIALLDKSIELLNEKYGLSEKDINNILNRYRNNLKKVN